MSKKAVRIAIAAAVATVFSTAALADSMNMDVTAKVTGTCKMAAAPALDFGTLDPANAVDVSGKTTTIKYLCTKGKAPASLTIDTDGDGSYDGAMVDQGSSGDTIAFNLVWGTTLPAGQGMGTGKDVSVTVTGSLLANDYKNVTAGDYKVTLPVVITP